MPTIDPSLIPLVTPGNLTPALTENSTLAVRWLVAKDPHYFDTYNRPLGDIVLRQLIISKSMDQLGLRLSGQSNFPFLISCTVDVDTSVISLPLSWIWDMHISLSDSWENLRLAVIQRSSGTNDPTSGDVTGTMRLIFTANQVGNTSEVGMFYVDYNIDSDLTYQVCTIVPATLSEFPNPIPTNQHELIAGFVVLRTLDIEEHEDFFLALTPGATDVTGTSTTYTDYEITDTSAGSSSVSNDFSYSSISHGTGILVPGAYNVIPPVGVDELSVLSAINYPWRSGTSLVSTDQLTTIPNLLFSQFAMTAPMGDRDSFALEENYKIVCTKIRRLDASATRLQMYFSTNNTIIDSTSDALIEFATVILNRSDIGTSGPDTVLEIVPSNNLMDNSSGSAELFKQNFGSGFAVLSSEWSTNTAEIDLFFASFETIIDEPPEKFFTAQLNEFALHRTPLNVPTVGQSQALMGSTSRRSSPIYPSTDNRFLTEGDQGIGDQVNFNENSTITPNDDIDPIAYKGSQTNKSVTLLVNSANNCNFDYENDILPRLRILFGRDPIHFDEWFDGTTFKRYDQISNTWIG